MADRASVEVWDRIASFVDKPSDLLHFALAASRFCAVVIPAHLNYCAVSTDAYEESFWTDLTAKRAGRLRELNIAGFPPPADDDFYYSHFEQVMPDFESTFGRYNNKRFPRRTRCIFPPSTPPNASCLDCIKSVTPPWVSLMGRSAPTLDGLQKLVLHFTICDMARLSRCNFFAKINSPQLNTFELNLTSCRDAVPGERLDEAFRGIQQLKGGYSSFALTCRIGDGENQRVLDIVRRVLDETCRELQRLRVVLRSRDDLGIDLPVNWVSLWDSTWPCLRNLSLTNIRIDDAERDAASAFFQRHRHIEVLTVKSSVNPAYYLDLQEALPKLRELDMPGLVVDTLIALIQTWSGEPNRPLESLAFRAGGPEYAIREAVDLLCQHGGRVGSLRRLHFIMDSNNRSEGHTWLRMIAQCNPQLVELNTDPSATCEDEDEWQRLLEWFPNLEVLRGYEEDCWVEYGEDEEDPEVPEVEGIIREQRRLCPKLRQFDEWVKISEDEWTDSDGRRTMRI